MSALVSTVDVTQTTHRPTRRGRALRWLLLAGAALLPMLRPAIARGGGFEVPMQSARGAGFADAFVAGADDPSAVWYDPAAMTTLKGTQASVGAEGLFPQFHFEGAAGNERMGLPSVLPHIYATSDLGTDRWRLGVGVNNIFGINEDYGDKGPLRLVVNKAKLAVINLQPTVAYKVDDHLSVGAGLNVYYGQLILQRNAQLAAPPVPEGDFRVTGTDFAVGGTASVRYQFDDRNALAAFYRSPFSLDFSGRARLIDPGVTPEIGPSRTHESIDFPQSIGLGYALRVCRPLKVEADVVWTDWHSIDQLKLHSSNPAFNNQTIPADWKSGFTYRVGAQYDFDQHWAVRGGYAFSQNAVPSTTFNPLIPDSNYHLFALGGSYTAGKWTLDAAYQLIYRERRHINDDVVPLLDGTWDNTIHTVMLTFTYRL